MGISTKEIEGVTEVIIKTGRKEIRIEGPSVSTIAVQGQVMYQVAGGQVNEIEKVAEPPAPPTITDEDVRLVATQANVSVDDARKALEGSAGDLAKAIILLKGEKRST